MARVDVRAPQVLVALATVVAVECTRVVFTVSFHASEDLGNIPAGLVVIAVLVAPALVGPISRLVPLRPLLLVVASAAMVARLAVQVVSSVSFPLAVVATFLALALLVVAVALVRGPGPSSSVAAVGAVTCGLALDLVIRGVGTTWDIPWRDDVWSAVATGGLLVGVVVAVTLVSRSGLVAAERRGAWLLVFLVWPFLYLALLYCASPAYLSSSGGLGYPPSLLVAFVSLVAALVGVVAGGRLSLPRVVLVGIGVLTGVLAWFLAGTTGIGVVLAAPLALGLAGLTLGHVAAADHGAPRPGAVGNALGFAGGGLWVGVTILAFSVHTLQPLPVTNRVIPALVGLSLALAGLAPAAREVVGPAWSAPGLRWAMGSLVAAALLVPAGVALAWPSSDQGAARDDRLRVMTFNIDQGVTDGRLDLEQLARYIEVEDPDVVVLEEVGRGWALSGATDEGAWFSRRLGMPFVWAPAADDQFGNVVLSRVPITSTRVLDLGKGNGTQARSAALVHLDLNGRDVLVIGTHLMNGSQEPMHVSRGEAYDAILAAWGGASDTIFVGDMNTYPRSVPPGWPELDIPLGAGFGTTQDTDLCTMPTSNRNCPDWIFAGPGVVSSPVWLGADRPDHRPVVADVSFG